MKNIKHIDMLMKKALTLFALMMSVSVIAQDVQWASEVLDYSSEFGRRQYSAQQILGKPNVLPNLGLSPNAWTPRKKNSEEFIKVGFESPSSVRQIAIAETKNPGAIKYIYAYDESGNEYLLNEFNPVFLPIEGRLFRFFIDPTAYKVSALKIVIDGNILPGYFGIDAIGITSSMDPITVEINITEDVNNDYLPVAMGPEINTEYKELRPLISQDGKTLYFSRRNHPDNVGGVKDDEDIWFSHRDSIDSPWEIAKNIGPPLNNKGPNFISSLSSDGNSMIVLLGNAYYSKRRMMDGVSMSTKQPDGSWSKPVNLKIRDGYNYSPKANYFLTDDNKTMLMSVERDDSFGDRDLYVSFQLEDGTWAQPKNLGPTVNSADEEAAPFLSSDGKTLFFSSKGFSGYGGYDIFLSRRLDDTWTNWSEPENLGASFNSKEDDIFFNFTENDEYAYFSRGNQDDTDIFKVKLPYYQKPLLTSPYEYVGPKIVLIVKGTVYNSKTGEKVGADIEFENLLNNDDKIELVFSDPVTGEYSVRVPQNMDFRLTAKAKGFYPKEDSLFLSHYTESAEIVKDFYLDPIIKNEPIVLKNIQFDFDSDVIRAVSFPELDKISELLLDNDDIKIEINGHTCSMGSIPYNQRLSERRAASVVRYLQGKGVEKDRLFSAGYGELQPTASNETEEGRITNRRVEFELKDYDNAIPAL
jgi:OmpA-OmpF porin, OOP family